MAWRGVVFGASLPVLHISRGLRASVDLGSVGPIAAVPSRRAFGGIEEPAAVGWAGQGRVS